jgi:transketolase
MDLSEYAKKIRLHALRMTSRGGSSHIGSVFSRWQTFWPFCTGRSFESIPQNPSWEERDRFLLSKGHAGAGIYAALAEKGFFPVSRLDSHYQDGSLLSGHVSHKGIPGVEFSTGSLGHGLPVAGGMAYAAKLSDKKHRVFAVLSDGECDEGSNWEAVLFASHHKLDNLTVVVDYNKIQSLASVSETLELEPFSDKWKAFGWNVREVDGHDHKALKDAFDRLPFSAGKPSCVIAHTIKGKGVSFMENSVLWHYRTARGEEFEAAAKELEKGGA